MSRNSAAMASSLSSLMMTIQNNITQTSKGSDETVAAIERLVELANELKSSVAGFRLPDDVQYDFSRQRNAQRNPIF